MIFIILILISCRTASDYIDIKTNEKLTFIFDFDKTMYFEAEDHKGYIRMMYDSVVKNSKYSSKKIQDWSNKNVHDITTPSAVNEFIQKFHRVFDMKIRKKDMDYAVLELNKVQTVGLKDIILKLKSQGHQVLIIGGATWGCGIIPEFAKQFGIEKTDIYSGYFKDFSDTEIKKAMYDKYKYTNCGNLELQTPISNDKSDVIKFLKDIGIIKGKVVHIGDGKNDLDVWKSGQVDLFIGFGINRVVSQVEQEAPVFVKTVTEFQDIIKDIITIKIQRKPVNCFVHPTFPTCNNLYNVHLKIHESHRNSHNGTSSRLTGDFSNRSFSRRMR